MNSNLQPKALDPVYYLVICDDGLDGPYVTETVLDRMDRTSTLKDIRQGQYGPIAHVIEISLTHHLCREATSDPDFVGAIDEVNEARAEAQWRRG